MAALSQSQQAALAKYKKSTAHRHLFGYVHRLLYRWFGVYLSFSYTELPNIRRIYNSGEAVTIQDVRTLIRARDGMSYGFEVPVEQCIWGYGWRYTKDENPLSLYYEHAPILSAYYQDYRPQNLVEALKFENIQDRTQPSVSMIEELTPPIKFMPWPGKCGLRPEEGCNLSGPVSGQLLAIEHYRLDAIKASLAAHGWQPDKYEGYIKGFFLIRGNDFLFQVNSGCHRAAALSHLGRKTLPVIFHPYTPRAVDITVQPDEAMLACYFDENLRQKRKAFLRSLV